MGASPMSDPIPSQVRVQLVAVLTVAVLGISSSAVLVRGMEAGPLAIAAWRCAFAAVLLSPALRSAERRPVPRDLAALGVAGVFLGLHFGTWFASIGHTTILRSTVLVAMVPVWTGVLEWSLLGVRPRRGFWAGIALALLGVALMGAGGSGSAGWRGDLEASVAAVLWAVYLLIVRSVRARVDVGSLMAVVCAAASVSCFALAAASGEALVGFPAATWGLIGLATLGPQLLGHQGFAWAVRWLPAATVAAITLLEPVGATLLAALVLAEVPPVGAALGGGLVLAGVLLALLPPGAGGGRQEGSAREAPRARGPGP